MKDDGRSETMRIIRDAATASALKQHIPADKAIMIGRLTAENLLNQCGGQRLYIPCHDHEKTAQRNQKILENFNGANGDAICQQYAIGRSTLYRLIKFDKKK